MTAAFCSMWLFISVNEFVRVYMNTLKSFKLEVFNLDFYCYFCITYYNFIVQEKTSFCVS